MKTLTRFSKQAILLAVATVLLAAGSISSFAASRTAVLRVDFPGTTETGKCCFDWDLSLRVMEPERLVPIIVTWSADYQANAWIYSGIRVNDAPCSFDGPGNISPYMTEDSLSYTTRTVQWLIMPGDYRLVKGLNVITLCGGGVYSDSDQLTIGFNTLTVQLAF